MSSPSGKRSRDPEEEDVYLDNFHSHKRYLSEIMASSLNCLTVGDSISESLMESPSSLFLLPPRERERGGCCVNGFRCMLKCDEVNAPYSPMSEDSDDPRFICDPPVSTPVQSDAFSRPTSPVSPHRHLKPPCTLFQSGNPYPLPASSLPPAAYSHPRRGRSESEGRFPSSPSDMCHIADLRKAALLRSVQMRTQPSCSSVHGAQSNMHSLEEVGEEHRTCSCDKTPDEEVGYYRSLHQVPHYDVRFSDANLH